MNTKLYKQVYALAGEMVEAAESENDALFDDLYQQLKSLCEDNEADEVKNHPVQWETLADFTGDCAEALLIYQKALSYAQAIDAYDYMASIHYAMGLLLFEETDLPDQHRLEKALAAVQAADEFTDKINDQELQSEIKKLLAVLSK